MEPKTLIEHIRQTWPDVEQIDPSILSEDGLLYRHKELIRLVTNTEQEVLTFRKKGITLQLLEETVRLFLRNNNMEVNSPPNSLEIIPGIKETERHVLGLYGSGVETANGFKQLGEIYYLVYYAETGLIIIFSYSGELQWAKK